MEIYIVKEKDTVDTIAAYFSIPVARLIYVNQLVYPYRLAIGQALLITEEPVMGGRKIKANGFAYPFISPYVLGETLPYLAELSVFSYGFTTEGILLPPNLPITWMISAAKRTDTKPILTLTPLDEEGRFNNQLIHEMLVQEEARETLVEQIYNTVMEESYEGVNIDFEYILAEDRNLFTAFVEEVTLVMEVEGYEVTVDVAPKIAANQPGLLYEGKDYAGLGAVASRVLVMTYEWGYTYGPPMAVAPIQKVKEVLDYAVTEIPREKIMMGIPNYGYDWPLPYVRGETKATTIGNVQAVQIAVENGAEILFDETSQTPYFQYEKNGELHEVWFEDARSIRAKYQLLKSYPLHGFGCWQIMRLFRVMWVLAQE